LDKISLLLIPCLIQKHHKGRYMMLQLGL